jgi:hypothetical protein
MPRLSTTERMQVIAIFYEIKNLVVRNQCKKVAEIARQRNINISEEGVCFILIKWRSCKIYILFIK